MEFDKLQKMQKIWMDYNFPKATASAQFHGVVEEVGELAHARLKKSQGIRGSEEKHNHDIKDAVGDIVIYLAGLCNKEGISLDCCVNQAWNEIKDRDWIKFPGNGRTK